MSRGSQDCGKAQRRSRQGISISKDPEAGIGLATLLYLDHEVWLQLVSEVEVEVEALRALEAMGTLCSRGGM